MDREKRIGRFLNSLEAVNPSEGQENLIFAADLNEIGGDNLKICKNNNSPNCNTNMLSCTNGGACDTNVLKCENVPGPTHPILNGTLSCLR